MYLGGTATGGYGGAYPAYLYLYSGLVRPVLGSVQLIKVPMGPVPSPPGILIIHYVYMHIIKVYDLLGW